MTEKQFENKVKQFLKDNGIVEIGTPIQKRPDKINGWFVKIWGGGFQRGGIPDILANVNGYFVAIELKAANGKPSDLQLLNIDLIKQGGGRGYILYPKDYEKFKKDIKKLLTM